VRVIGQAVVMTGTLVDANGTSLYAEQTGNGSAIVFVHGMCGDAGVWHGQFERLQDRFRCIAYDRRGHSRSPRTDVIETVGLHADDLAALIEKLGVSPCIVVGSSCGARIVVDFIRRYPSMVRAALVSEPPIGAVAPDEFAQMIGEIAPSVKAAAEADGPRAAVDAFFEMMCPGLWALLDEPAKDRYRDNAPMLFADLGMPPYEITPADVRAIEVRTLMVRGTTSFAALQTVAQNLAEWLPNAELLVLDCGHVTYAEKPDEFADAVAKLASTS
jgi:pimeloyl-ACP methyl ester carboxylesterase